MPNLSVNNTTETNMARSYRRFTITMIQVTQNPDGSLTFELGTASLGPITAGATSITIAGQFKLPAFEDPRIARARVYAQEALSAVQDVVNELA